MMIFQYFVLVRGSHLFTILAPCEHCSLSRPASSSLSYLRTSEVQMRRIIFQYLWWYPREVRVAEDKRPERNYSDFCCILHFAVGSSSSRGWNTFDLLLLLRRLSCFHPDNFWVAAQLTGFYWVQSWLITKSNKASHSSFSIPLEIALFSRLQETFTKVSFTSLQSLFDPLRTTKKAVLRRLWLLWLALKSRNKIIIFIINILASYKIENTATFSQRWNTSNMNTST